MRFGVFPTEEPRTPRAGGPRYALRFAVSNPRATWKSLIRSGAWGGAVEPQRGDLPQPRPSAWVKRPNSFQCLSPEGATHRLASIPHISFVVLNAVGLQELLILLLEAYNSMVLFLVVDVLGHCPHLRRAQRKAAITILPMQNTRWMYNFDSDCGTGFNWRAPSGLKALTAPRFPGRCPGL